MQTEVLFFYHFLDHYIVTKVVKDALKLGIRVWKGNFYLFIITGPWNSSTVREIYVRESGFIWQGINGKIYGTKNSSRDPVFEPSEFELPKFTCAS